MQLKSLIPTLTPKHLNQIQAQILKSSSPHILNILLGTLTQSPTPQNALTLYNQMLHYPSSHNHFTFTHALKACSLLHAHQKGREIHARVVETGHFSDIFIANSLIHLYVVENDIVSARRVFDAISCPDVVSWTSIISGLAKCGFQGEAIAGFLSMDVKPNCTTLVGILSACSRLEAVRLCESIHCYCLKNIKEYNNIVLDNALLDFYLKYGSLSAARYLFVKMPKRDVVSWTTMVGGLAQRGFCEEAVWVFEKMVHGGEAEPNEATIVNVLSACSSRGSLSLGQWVHSYYASMKCDLVMNGTVGNALLNMYVKCGDMGTAIKVFNMLESKDIVSWSTVISGMAMNGHGRLALPLFSLMLVHGVAPDDVTFIGLLSACSQTGLLNQGLMFFTAMNDIYQVVPQMRHYACVVDLYGRAGLLEEAESFVRDMPMEAQGPVLGALLSACRIHGNEEMFERINRSLSAAEGVSIGTFALLSNSFASCERWEDANKVRDEMRCNGLRKMAGYSWIDPDA